MARPLTSLTKKNAIWTWGPSQEEAFQKIKDVLVSRPVLAIYNPQFMTELHTDASQVGIGSILLQRPSADAPLRAVAYFSRQTTAEEQHFHSYELETLAVVMSLHRFRVYLIGIEFKIVTDCHAVRSTWAKRDLVPRIARWWLHAQEYNFTIEYRAGTQMGHADALSRNPSAIGTATQMDTPMVNILKITTPGDLESVQLTDPELNLIKCILDSGSTEAKNVRNEYALKEVKIYKKVGDALRWAVPRDARWKVCHMSHDECGHFSYEKTMDKIKQTY